jgi:hypothetical protein
VLQDPNYRTIADSPDESGGEIGHCRWQ